MLQITNLSEEETIALLQAVKYGHLGCSKDDQPYIIPMHYACSGKDIYFLTTAGMKTEYLAANAKVCLQIERIDDERHWQSVIVLGHVEQLFDAEELGRAGSLIVKQHSSLVPALNKTIVNDEERSGAAVIYCLRPTSMTGRKTVKHKLPHKFK